ncbi:MAG: hypothetical protein OEY88_05130 [Candidatus Bathyarchaeota archaeon]|nr:hypothetical protein [Candidatus Bathyarchaeota archaeon]
MSSLDKLTKNQIETIFYIYIGQNVRDQGILKQDSYLKKMANIVESLLHQGIVEESRWYKFDVLRISYRFTVPIREKVEAKLRNERQKLHSVLRLIPSNLLSFLVFEYLSDRLSFPVKDDWLFDWRDILLENDTMERHRKSFFKTLADFGFCVISNSYVSTRGGELRGEEYIINAEIRKFLEETIPHLQFPPSLKDLIIVHSLIYNKIAYERNSTVKVTIGDEEIAELGSQPGKAQEALDNLLDRLSSTKILYETTKVQDFGIELLVNRRGLLGFIKRDVQDQIVEPLLSQKPGIHKEEGKEEPNFLMLVRALIDAKFSLYKTAAQFGGKEIFKSLPYIERCVVDLTNPSSGEEGLQRFIGNLHQVLEESSAKETLKFREGDFTSLEDWLGVEIPSEASLFYEDSKSFFRDFNRLRNFYSHSVDAKGVFDTGQIFNRLIGKYSPDEDDIIKTEAILLQRSVRALQGLERALRMAWQKKMGI